MNLKDLCTEVQTTNGKWFILGGRPLAYYTTITALSAMYGGNLEDAPTTDFQLAVFDAYTYVFEPNAEANQNWHMLAEYINDKGQPLANRLATYNMILDADMLTEWGRVSALIPVFNPPDDENAPPDEQTDPQPSSGGG